jgi:PKHD-type hydroxylase
MINSVNDICMQIEGALSKEFCNGLLSQFDWDGAKAATINMEQPLANLKIRRADILWEDPMQPLGCIAKTYIEAANQASGWNFILGSQSFTQIGRYKGSDNGHYDWHVDIYPPKDGFQRKLSISILLSDPSDFEGGELQFKDYEGEKVLTKQGSIVVFPSFIEHRVAPVTKGVRCSAVAWVSGPAFR